jgi:hypothetical protein
MLERGARSGEAPADGEVGHGAVEPTGNNDKGGSTTASVGNKEERSSPEVERGGGGGKGKDRLIEHHMA